MRGGQCLGVLNVYNPGRPVTREEFKYYIAQVGNKFVIVGDLNCHSKLLDSKCVRANFSGISLEKLIMDNDVCLVNPIDMYTYVNPHSGKRPCLDLCLASPNVAAQVNVNTDADIGSDHVPIKVGLRINPCVNDIVFPKKIKITPDDIARFSENLSQSKVQ